MMTCWEPYRYGRDYAGLIRLVVVALCVLLMGGADAAWAQAAPEKVCNTDVNNQTNQLGEIFQGVGLISTITGDIADILNTAWESLYQSVLDSRFPNIVSAVIILYVMTFGILYTLGLIQMKLNDAVLRVVKVTLVGIMIGGGSLAFFQDTVYRFFMTGSQELMQVIVTELVNNIGEPSSTCQNVGGGNAASADGAGGAAAESVFLPMDQLICDLIKPGTLMILEGAMSTPPWGIAYVAVTLFGGLFLAAAIARAVWVYVMSLVALTFLFGLAPIFFCFIMFDRTKEMFNGWVSQVLNFVLQPLLMFTFITFFLVMMHIVLKDSLLEAEVCYGPVEELGVEGGSHEGRALRFSAAGQMPLLVSSEWNGPQCLEGTQLIPCPEGTQLPLDMMGMLTFLLLAYVSFQFYNVVIGISSDIADAFISLEIGSPVQSAIDGISGGISGGINAAMRGEGFEGVMRATGFGSVVAPTAPPPQPTAPPAGEDTVGQTATGGGR